MLAAHDGSEGVVRLLLNAGVAMDAAKNDGGTLLANVDGKEEVVTQALKEGTHLCWQMLTARRRWCACC